MVFTRAPSNPHVRVHGSAKKRGRVGPSVPAVLQTQVPASGTLAACFNVANYHGSISITDGGRRDLLLQTALASIRTSGGPRQSESVELYVQGTGFFAMHAKTKARFLTLDVSDIAVVGLAKKTLTSRNTKMVGVLGRSPLSIGDRSSMAVQLFTFPTHKVAKQFMNCMRSIIDDKVKSDLYKMMAEEMQEHDDSTTTDSNKDGYMEVPCGTGPIDASAVAGFFHPTLNSAPISSRMSF